MRKLLDALTALPEYARLLAAAKSGATPVAAGGLNAVHKTHIAAALAAATGRPLLLVAPDELDAAAVAQDAASFLGTNAVVLPSREFNFHDVDAASRDFENRRIAALDAFLRPNARLFVASADALRARTLPRRVFDASRIVVTQGATLDIDSFAEALVRGGYRRAAQVEGAGQFAIRGGIVDVFSPADTLPVRIELWGDEVDTLATFDPVSQRRLETLTETVILPSSETLAAAADGGASGFAGRLRSLAARVGGTANDTPLKDILLADAERIERGLSFAAADRWLDLMYGDAASPLDYLPDDTLVVVLNHGRAAERAVSADRLAAEDYKALLELGYLHPRHIKFHISIDDLYNQLSNKLIVYLDTFIGAAYPIPPKLIETFQARQLPSYGGSVETAVGDVKHYLRSGLGVLLLCRDTGRARRLSELLFENGVTAALDYSMSELPTKGRARIALGSVSAGFEYPALGLAVIAEGQIVQAPPRKVTKKSARNRVRSYTDLVPGDYVVHEHHGIARFVGIVTMNVEGIERDYVKLSFLGQDALYVPATQLDLVSKYIGGGEDSGVRLSKLGGAEWKRSKSKAKSAARELAAELINLYAARARMTGYSFPEDDEMQRDFEARFEFDETDDQLVAAREIKDDMQKSAPMDRLLCGDVGFGKTEVALRAAMKAIIAGKQVAFLVPTTVLCQQHFLTAQRRFAGYPVTIDVLSRFRSPAEQSKTLEKLKNGGVDLLIGTHRLLQKDVVFKNIGLLIVDEEQRFGVGHKERMKEISRDVDVLTLSATPIPRTLNMALSGIRDMSSLEDAPMDRHPVQTYVLEQDNNIILDACRRELARGGQVYYLHNRIETIDRTARKLSEALPGINVAAAHGAMGEQGLADIMLQMEDGQLQVLVCTTIIETGIDIPNVNTLIVEDADRFGLAQLHQLRGRVGRSRRHAYAYLCYRRGKVLTEIAEKRLTAIREFAEFGAGFKIAMRDLEIRGAGNVLGHAQSGHMLRVGYDMYLKLLEEAVAEEKGEAPPSMASCTADLAVTASIPESYVSDSGQRMDLYRRIAAVRTEEDASDLIDELCDRYGDIPDGAHALIRIARLRAEASARGMSEISQKEGRLNVTLAVPDFAAVSKLCAEEKYRGRLYFSAGTPSALSLKLGRGADVLGEAEAIVRGYM